ncbi:MAG: GDP-mannose 4,6-dehydratase [Gammaproteobacteria bacterium]
MAIALVLGVNGQDGSYLAEEMLDRGHDVIGLGRQAESRYVIPSRSFRYQMIDLTQDAALEAVLDTCRPDVCFHFAAIHGPAGFAYEGIWRQMMRVNVLSLHTLLEFARVRRPRMGIVYAGSAKIYPSPWCGLINETTPYCASCLYSIGKIASLDLIRQYVKTHEVAASNLVLFNHESARRGPPYLLPTLADAVVRARIDPSYTTAVKTLNFYADWCSASEVASIAVDVGMSRARGNFVVASGHTWFARDAIEAIFRRYGLDHQSHIRESLPPSYPGPAFRVSVRRLQHAVGRRPNRELLDIMDEMVAEAERRHVATMAHAVT